MERYGIKFSFANHLLTSCTVIQPELLKSNGRYLLGRVGIIGEPMSGFNPLTLAPFDEEQETGDGAESR